VTPSVPVYDRTSSTGFEEIDRWSGGVGWLAHPDEEGQRASHAIACEDGVWIIDPVDAPGVDDLLDELGEVAGVAVLSSYHTRDADAVATCHDVPVHVPRWMDRVGERVDARVEQYECTLGDTGFRIYRFEPLSMYQEAVAYRESDGTLLVPDSLGTADLFRVGDERLGLELLRRLLAPSELAGLEPERILVGHGEPVTVEPGAALRDTRRRAPDVPESAPRERPGEPPDDRGGPP